MYQKTSADQVRERAALLLTRKDKGFRVVDRADSVVRTLTVETTPVEVTLWYFQKALEYKRVTLVARQLSEKQGTVVLEVQVQIWQRLPSGREQLRKIIRPDEWAAAFAALSELDDMFSKSGEP
jgi:hypothetical protein